MHFDDLNWKTIKALKKHGSVKDNYLLSKQYVRKKNIKQIDQLPLTSSFIALWYCKKHDYEWKAKVYDRFKGRGCKYCGIELAKKNKKITLLKNNSINLTHPDILKEWDYENNIIKPEEISFGSHTLINWICARGHRWTIAPHNRISNNRITSCPYCNSNKTSRAEIFIYTELKYLLNKVSWRKKLFGKEIDIYLEDYNLGIEYDGDFYHSNKKNKDLKKNIYFKNKKIEIIRIRSNKLKKISNNDLLVNQQSTFNFAFIKKIILFLRKKNKFSIIDKQKIAKYLANKKLMNVKSYNKIIEYLPGPLPDQSIQKLYPLIASEWDYNANYPLTPLMFSEGSNFSFYWICSICNKSYLREISKRTLRSDACDNRECKIIKRTKKRLSNNVDKYGSILDNKFLKLEFNTDKNLLKPGEVHLQYTKDVHWKCSKCSYEFTASPSRRTMRKSGCLMCYNRNRSKRVF